MAGEPPRVAPSRAKKPTTEKRRTDKPTTEQRRSADAAPVEEPPSQGGEISD
jgi:hypothetical protein